MIIKRDFLYTPKGENRMLHIWLPEDYENSHDRYPVMYFFDGHNLFNDADATYGKSWGFRRFLSRWDRKMILVGIECSHVGNERLNEYLPYPPATERFGALKEEGNLTLDWIAEEIKPMIDREYRTLPDRANTGIGGSSMGGLMAIRAVLGYNHVFSRAACVSSAIGFSPEATLADAEQSKIDANTRVFLSWGSREAWGSKDPLHADPASPSYKWNQFICHRVRIQGGRGWMFCQEGGGHCEADWEKLVPGFMHFLWKE